MLRFSTRRLLRRAIETYRDALAHPPSRHQPPERLSGARRRYRHQHGPHPRVGGRRAGLGRARDGRGLRGHRPRLADGRPRQLGGHPLADPPRPDREHRRSRRRRGAGAGRGARRRRRRRVRRGDASGRRHHLDRHARRVRRRAATAAATGSVLAVVDAARGAGASRWRARPSCWPVLKDAGVVDAGGAGLLLFFDSLLHVLDGRALPRTRRQRPRLGASATRPRPITATARATR